MAVDIEHSLAEVMPMASFEQVSLFRSGVYRDQVLPAYRAFISRGERGPIRTLLQRARPLALEARSRPSQGEMDRLVQESAAELMGRRRADGLTAREGAARIVELAWPVEPSVMTRSEIDLAIAQLDGAGVQGRAAGLDANRTLLALIDLLCIPWEGNLVPAQEVGRSMLGEYLESKSEWIVANLLHGYPSGPEIEVPNWSAMSTFLPEELLTLANELAKAGRPKGPAILIREFDRLEAIVRTAAEKPEFTLVVWSRPGPP